MINTYTQVYIHLIFAVDGKENLIHEKHNNELQQYISQVVTELKQQVIAIQSMPDHLHVLIGMEPETSLNNLVLAIKTKSEDFINNKKWQNNTFRWQEGYGAFSCSSSQLDRVMLYIQNQKAHHTIKSFKEEYLEWLEMFNIDYESNDEFDWIE